MHIKVLPFGLLKRTRADKTILKVKEKKGVKAGGREKEVKKAQKAETNKDVKESKRRRRKVRENPRRRTEEEEKAKKPRRL